MQSSSSEKAILYHIVEPQNVKPQYQEYDTIDFNLSAQGRKFVGGSVRLCGDVVLSIVGDASNSTLLSKNVCYEGFVGSHSWIDLVSTSFQTTGMVESILDYPRLQSAKSQATLSKEDLNSSLYVCENRVPGNDFASAMLKGYTDISKGSSSNPYVPAFSTPLDFAVKLDICINNCLGDNLLPYAKTGDIRVSLKLAGNRYVLYGDSNIGGTITYQLKNLKMMYQSVPDTGKYSPSYPMRINASIKQAILSSYANITAKMPMVCDSMFATFLVQTDDNNALANGLANQRPPLVNRLEFIWNDSFSQEITYALTSEQEILNNYIKSVAKQVGSNNAQLNTLSSNQGYGIGLDFGQFVDMSKSKIGINILSGVSNAAPYIAYLFFSGIFTL